MSAKENANLQKTHTQKEQSLEMSDSLYILYKDILVRALVWSGVANKVFDQSF